MSDREWTPIQLIRMRRRAATIQAIAAKIGCEHPTVSRFERGLVKKPTAEFKRKWVSAVKSFGVRTSLAELERALKQTQGDADDGRTRAA